jgi:hypothetical protein
MRACSQHKSFDFMKHAKDQGSVGGKSNIREDNIMQDEAVVSEVTTQTPYYDTHGT